MTIESRDLTSQGIEYNLPTDFKVLSVYFKATGIAVIDIMGTFDGPSQTVTFRWATTGEIPAYFLHGTSEGNLHVFYRS